MIGRTLGHYRIVERIGAGGMGEVYRAHDEHLERDVALKVLSAGVLNDESIRKRFRREALALSKLNHPNIATVFDFATQDGVDFLAMELIRGAPLTDSVDAGPLAADDSLRLSIQLLEGLVAAHTEGIIHRDLKPGNLMITSHGRLKILDFGLAAAAPSAADPDVTRSLSEMGTVSGTVPYMSPEQLRGKPPDARSDVYSAGAVIYEMIAGRRAFPQTQGAELIGAILHQTPDQPSRHNPRITSALERVVMKALERDPAQRYQSAAEFLAALVGLNISAAQPARRRPWWLVPMAAASSIAFVVVIVLAFNPGHWRDRLLRRTATKNAGATISNPPVAPRPSVAVFSFKNVSGRNDKAWLSTALSEMLTTELAAGERLRIVPAENVSRMKVSLALTDTDSYSKETLSKIRANLGSDSVVLGSFVPLGGDEVRLDLRLQDAVAGEILANVSAKGRESQIDDLVQRAGMELRQRLGAGQVSNVQALAVRATRSANATATRFYAEGLARLRVFEMLAARDLLQKAVAADPDYPLAHAALASAWSELGYGQNARKEAKKAFDLSANLSREDRLSIEARYRGINHESPREIEIYRTLWTFFPDNVDYGYALAMAQNDARRPNDALATVEEMRRLPAPLKDDPRIDDAELEAAAELGDFKRMQAAAAKAAAAGESKGARLLVARARVRECSALEQLGQVPQARSLCDAGRRIYETAGDQAGVAWSLNNLGILQWRQADLNGAQETYKQALAVYRKIGKQDGVAAVLTNSAAILEEQGKLTEAAGIYRQVIAICRQTGDTLSEAIALVNDANTFSRLGDLTSAKASYEQALDLSRQVGNKSLEAMALNNLASTLTLLGDFGKAKSMLQQAHTMMNEARNKSNLVYVLSGEGDLALVQGDLEEARGKYQAMLNTAKEVGQNADAATAQVSLAQVALETGQAAESVELARRAAETFRSQEQSDGELAARMAVASGLMAQNKLGDARKEVDNAASLARKTHDLSARVGFEILSARIQGRNGETEKAKKGLAAALADATKHGLLNYAFEARLALGDIEIRSGQATAGHDRLRTLERDATARSFLLIARKAANAQK